MRGWLLFACCFVGMALAIGLWGWPSYRQHQAATSGLRAAELGAQLAFMENTYRAKTGKFTADFSRLEPFLETPVPCPLSAAPYVCEDYEYTLEEPHWLLATFRKDPQIYIAFELEQGGVDCTHASEALKQTPVCSDFE